MVESRLDGACVDAPGGHGHGGHARGHALRPGSLDRAMAIGVGLNAVFVAAEVAAGVWSGSLALVADAGHNAGDVLGLLLAWGAAWLARRPPTPRYTWGLRRFTIYAALANAGLLLAACVVIVREAVLRFWQPAPVGGPAMIAVAAVGTLVNALTAALFVRGHNDANVRGAYLHMAADAAVSAGVVVAGIAILATGLVWIDPAVGILIALVILAGTWGLLGESIDLALDAVPRGIDPGAVREALGRLGGVLEIRDLHVWAASTSEPTLTVHLLVAAGTDRDGLLGEAETLVHDRFRIAHSTIQIDGRDSRRE